MSKITKMVAVNERLYLLINGKLWTSHLDDRWEHITGPNTRLLTEEFILDFTATMAYPVEHGLVWLYVLTISGDLYQSDRYGGWAKMLLPQDLAK